MKLYTGPKLKFPALEISVMPPRGRQRGPRLSGFAPIHHAVERQGDEGLLIGELGRIERSNPGLGLDAQRSAIVRTRGRDGRREQASDRK